MRLTKEDLAEAQRHHVVHIHEAGHAVAYLEEDRPFGHVDLLATEEWLGQVAPVSDPVRRNFPTDARCALAGPIAELIGKLDRDDEDADLAWDEIGDQVWIQIGERTGDFDHLVRTHITSLCAYGAWQIVDRASVAASVGFHVKETTMIVCERWGHVMAIADRLLERRHLSHAEVMTIVDKAPRRPRAWKRLARRLSWLSDPEEPIVTEIWEHVERLRAKEGNAP